LRFGINTGVRLRNKLLILFTLLVVGLAGAVLLVGLALARPFQTVIGPPPPDLDAQAVEIPSSSGSVLHGWLAAGRPGGGVVVLMHGVRANRLAMERRAIVLKQQGFSVLLFDFQAHGESPGRHITFGHLEGLDAQAVVVYVRQRWPNEHIGAICVSLGGAAALLGPEPLKVDALVLESVFPDIHLALTDRLRARIGGFAGRAVTPLVAPVFEALLPPILGVRLDQLRPIDRIGSVTAPVLVAAGTADAYTTIDEARDCSPMRPSRSNSGRSRALPMSIWKPMTAPRTGAMSSHSSSRTCGATTFSCITINKYNPINYGPEK
jgi:pimeloyl-ACP methyl ester carboxylesterase